VYKLKDKGVTTNTTFFVWWCALSIFIRSILRINDRY